MQELIDLGFRLAGEWRTPQCRVHHAPWLRYEPGVYAFVAADRVRYIGKASQLHSQLGNYSYRCFGRQGAKKLRLCHRQIAITIASGQSVEVYVRLAGQDNATPLELKRDLVRTFSPAWNVEAHPSSALPAPAPCRRASIDCRPPSMPGRPADVTCGSPRGDRP